MKSEENCYYVSCLIFVSVNYLNYMKYILHEIFQDEEQMPGKIGNNLFALEIFSPIFHDLVSGAFPRYSGCLMRSGKDESMHL